VSIKLHRKTPPPVPQPPPTYSISGLKLSEVEWLRQAVTDRQNKVHNIMVPRLCSVGSCTKQVVAGDSLCATCRRQHPGGSVQFLADTFEQAFLRRLGSLLSVDLKNAKEEEE
jgi:hypothetical protein